ncbi:MAG: hypothetical protein FJ138_07180 [Deltaproteobacteria bacterium]|nr:hypothetical protein [Deltaproteobacteria bacterium]
MGEEEAGAGAGAQRALLLHRAGVSAFLAGKHHDAQLDAERALVLAPPEDLRRALLGLAALSAAQAAPEGAPEPADARLALREGRFEDAVALARDAARRAPDRAAELARVEGKALMGLGRAREAHEALSRALALGGEHPQLTLELARAAEVAGRPADALRGYQALARALAPAEGAPRPPLLDEVEGAVARLAALAAPRAPSRAAPTPPARGGR